VAYLTRSFRHRNYQLFFGGQLISLTGTWMQQIAQSWLVYRLTRSSELLGLVSFAGQIPVFLFAAIGGAAADRGHRHRIIVWTQTLSMALAFVLAALTITGRVRVWHLFVLSAALGLVNAFDIPARQAFMVEMVGREDLMNAIALNSSMVNGARVVGPAVAGAVVAAVGEGWCFLLNAISYVAVIAGLLLMRVPRADRVRSNRSAIADIVEGFTYVGRTAPVRAVLLLLGIVSLTAMPYSVLLPVFADEILHGGAKTLGLLTGASGVGALIGALSLAARRGVKGLGRWIAVSTFAFGATLLAAAVMPQLWAEVAVMLPVGAASTAFIATSNALLQLGSSAEMRGRVMALFSVVFLGSTPIGGTLIGWIAEVAGPRAALGVGSIATLAVGAAALIGVRRVRRSRQAEEVARSRAVAAASALAGEEPAPILTGRTGRS